jgi:hypothetical protein
MQDDKLGAGARDSAAMTVNSTASAFVFDAAAGFDTDIHGHIRAWFLHPLTYRKSLRPLIEAAIAQFQCRDRSRAF